MVISPVIRANGNIYPTTNGHHQTEPKPTKSATPDPTEVKNGFQPDPLEATTRCSIKAVKKLTEADESLTAMWPQLRKAMLLRWRDRSSPTRYGEKVPYLQTIEEIKTWIQQYPKAFFRLKELEFDKLKITVLPPEFLAFPLKFLEDISFYENVLITLPENFGHSWINLTRLCLSQTQLTTLPTGFGNQWKKLKYLDLCYNPLGSIPLHFGVNWTALQIIHLCNIGLETLDKDFGSTWTQLRILNISGNRLNSLPENFGENWNLEKFNLSNNQLKALPKGFGRNWTRLTEIYLNNAGTIGTLEEDFGSTWKSVRVVDLKGLSLTRLPDRFAENWKWHRISPNMQDLSVDIRGNLLTQVPAHFTYPWIKERVKLDDNVVLSSAVQ